MINLILFLAQMAFMIVFGGAELHELLTMNIGTSVSWALCIGTFALILLALSVQTWRDDRTWDSMQIVIIYAGWMILVYSWVVVMLIRGTARWNDFDTLNVAICLAGTAVTFGAARRLGLSGFRSMLSHPQVRASLAILFKSMPQVVMAVQLLMNYPLSVASTTVWVGHITILIRLAQIERTIIRTGKTPSLRAMRISEWSNEISWIIFTAVWL